MSTLRIFYFQFRFIFSTFLSTSFFYKQFYFLTSLVIPCLCSVCLLSPYSFLFSCFLLFLNITLFFFLLQPGLIFIPTISQYFTFFPLQPFFFLPFLSSLASFFFCIPSPYFFSSYFLFFKISLHLFPLQSGFSFSFLSSTTLASVLSVSRLHIFCLIFLYS